MIYKIVSYGKDKKTAEIIVMMEQGGTATKHVWRVHGNTYKDNRDKLYNL